VTRPHPALERFLTSGIFDRSAPSAPKLRSSGPTAGKSAPAKQHTHASSNVSILIKSSLHAQDHFIHMARSWRSAPAVTGRFQRPYSPTLPHETTPQPLYELLLPCNS
jgi:hypothetical protein